MKTITKNITLLLGVGLFAGGLFSFDYNIINNYYHYPIDIIICLVTGSILITIWLLKNVFNK